MGGGFVYQILSIFRRRGVAEIVKLVDVCDSDFAAIPGAVSMRRSR